CARSMAAGSMRSRRPDTAPTTRRRSRRTRRGPASRCVPTRTSCSSSDRGRRDDGVVPSRRLIREHPDPSPRWPLLYFALAGFDLLTIVISLSINHRLVAIYRHAVEVNQEWAEGLDRYAALAQLASEVNAPGNDVFDTRDVAGESRRLHAALGRFD